jgi:hypothetical protein
MLQLKEFIIKLNDAELDDLIGGVADFSAISRWCRLTLSRTCRVRYEKGPGF